MKLPKEKVIMTLIYGVKSSGNQAERALRETAKLSKDDKPKAKEVLDNDTYVDDVATGEASPEAAAKLADDLEIAVSRGGWTLKGITLSHQAPREDLSADGESINVAGLKWYPQEDTVSLDVSELNFAKKD